MIMKRKYTRSGLDSSPKKAILRSADFLPKLTLSALSYNRESTIDTTRTYSDAIELGRKIKETDINPQSSKKQLYEAIRLRIVNDVVNETALDTQENDSILATNRLKGKPKGYQSDRIKRYKLHQERITYQITKNSINPSVIERLNEKLKLTNEIASKEILLSQIKRRVVEDGTDKEISDACKLAIFGKKSCRTVNRVSIAPRDSIAKSHSTSKPSTWIPPRFKTPHNFESKAEVSKSSVNISSVMMKKKSLMNFTSRRKKSVFRYISDNKLGIQNIEFVQFKQCLHDYICASSSNPEKLFIRFCEIVSNNPCCTRLRPMFYEPNLLNDLDYSSFLKNEKERNGISCMMSDFMIFLQSNENRKIQEIVTRYLESYATIKYKKNNFKNVIANKSKNVLKPHAMIFPERSDTSDLILNYDVRQKARFQLKNQLAEDIERFEKDRDLSLNRVNSLYKFKNLNSSEQFSKLNFPQYFGIPVRLAEILKGAENPAIKLHRRDFFDKDLPNENS